MVLIDFDDTKKLWEFSQETINLAEQYQELRVSYAEALKTLKLGLAKAYSEGTIKETISEEKAYLQLSNMEDKYKQAISDMLEFEQHYKGLEKVIDARNSLVSLNQSLIKNQVTNS